MKITTLEVLQWNKDTNQYESVYEESYDYRGPVEEAKGGGSVPATTTQTTTSKPFPEQLPFVKRVFGEAEEIFDAGPQSFFPGETVAGFSPETEAALSGQVRLAQDLPGFLSEQTGALSNLLRSPDPANDPTVQAFADAATRPMIQQFENQILPGISTAAQNAGAFGGSRQDILENQAAEGLARAVGDTRAGIFNDAFSQQLMAQQRALGLAPQITSQLSLPSTLMSEVGATRENLSQAQMDAARERFDFEQMAPLMSLQNFSNLINQFGGSSVSGSMTSPTAQRSPVMGALGGAATGAGLASSLGLSNPWIGGAAAAGGLLGLF